MGLFDVGMFRDFPGIARSVRDSTRIYIEAGLNKSSRYVFQRRVVTFGQGVVHALPKRL